jgi:molybdopterin molybdotransferase
MTGAPLPEGADAVVPLEQTELVGDAIVRLQRPNLAHGQNVLPMGASLRIGDAVLDEGALLRPIEIAILAEVGRAMVAAIPRPRVAILPTGNEVVSVGGRPEPGQIRNSNGPMLRAAAMRAGADAVELGIARDDRDELTRWVEQGLAADVLVLSGGVSAGKFDLVPEVLASLGVEQVFHKISLRPGKPLWFGVKRDAERRVLVFGLPGNPVSSFVCFELFVRPAIAALAGQGFAGLPWMEARLSHAYCHAGGRAAYLPARVTMPASPPARQLSDQDSLGGPQVEILPWHGSADLATLARANALACLSAEKQALSPGALLRVVQI